MLIGLLLGLVALVIAREMNSLLVGESASRRDRASIRVAMLGVDEVHHVDRILTMQLSAHEILVTADVAFDEGADEVAAIAAIEERIRAAVPDAKQIFIEPVWR